MGGQFGQMGGGNDGRRCFLNNRGEGEKNNIRIRKCKKMFHHGAKKSVVLKTAIKTLESRTATFPKTVAVS